MRDDSPEAAWHLEQTAVGHVVSRLAAAFPDVSIDQVRAMVDTSHQSFAGSRIRDYVPMLVEKETRRQLRAQADDLLPPTIALPAQRVLSEAAPQG